MTDREMLELAARAAGLKEFTEITGRFAVRTRFTGMQDWSPWNPLTDDGDALRLVVKLKIDLYNYAPPITEFERIEAVDYRTAFEGALESCGSDPFAATRRAITRAAAEIGRQMEVTE